MPAFNDLEQCNNNLKEKVIKHVRDALVEHAPAQDNVEPCLLLFTTRVPKNEVDEYLADTSSHLENPLKFWKLTKTSISVVRDCV